MPKEPEELLSAKLEDCIRRSSKRPCFLGFLDEVQTARCKKLLEHWGTTFSLWGGYEGAERQMLGFFPEYLTPSSDLFPIAALTFLYRRQDQLSHRDFLGSFMSLGIERNVLGDILVGEGRCVTFLREEMAPYFCQNIEKIGKVGVKISTGTEIPLPMGHTFLDLSGVVASSRLDCVVAFLCRISREKASEMIYDKAVMLNYREIDSISHRVVEGDILSVRRRGKFIIDRLGPVTGKGRLSVKCRKYQ